MGNMKNKGKDCAFDGCGRPAAAKGLCHSHYMQQAAGRPLKPLRTYGERQPAGALHKRCNICKETKSVDEFYKTSVGGLRAHCKECFIEKQMEYNKKAKTAA